MPRWKGEFLDINSTRHVVLIQNENVPASAVDVTLGAEPVIISWNSEERFDAMNLSDCTITVATKSLLTGFFNPTANSVRVVVYKSLTGEVEFAGYVTPNTYSQDYARIWDEIQLNCTDALATTQYLKVPDSYRTSGNLSFRKILYDMINTINGNYFTPGDIMCPISRMVVSDSRVLGRGGTTDILDDLYINPQNFFDDDDDKTPWYWSDVVENICQYLCLQAVQYGDTLYLLDLDAHANGISTVWIHDAVAGGGMFTESQVYHTTGQMPQEVIDLGKKGVSGGSEPSITLDTVYNKICVKANRYASEDLLPDFFEEDDLVTDMTEVKELATVYKAEDKPNEDNPHGVNYTAYHWYYVLYQNPNFTSWWYGRNSSGLVSSTKLYHPQNHDDNITRLNGNFIGAQVVKIGSYQTTSKDNSKKSISWQMHLMVPVHGNFDDGQDTHAPRYANNADLSDYPIYEYNGNNAVNLTPAAGQTNYISISGKILFSYPYQFSQSITLPGLGLTFWTKPEGSDQYIIKHSNPVFSLPNEDDKRFEIKFMNNGNAGAHDSNNDNMQNFPVFPAVLKIGDKYWVCDWDKVDSQGYYTLECHWSTSPGSFPITINPAIGDHMIGKKFQIENQFDPMDGVDVQGNKITITADDNISGKIYFAICAPYPSVFDQIDEGSHGWWFWKHTVWYSDIRQLLSHIEAIWLEDFEMKINSTNKSLMTVDEDDYLYYNKTVNDDYVEEWDEGEWKINTLTPAGVSLSTVMYKEGSDFKPVGDLYDKAFQRQDIAERLFIRRMYANYYQPMIKYDVEVMTSAHKSRAQNSGTPLFPVFWSKSIGKYFYPMSAEIDVKQGKASLHLRQRVIDV